MKKLSISDAHEFATENGGKCLSDVYVGSQINLDWECKLGHTFSKPLKRVKRGEWCPYCSGKYVAYTTNDLQKVAESRGGNYITNKTLKVSEYADWECSNGHRWTAKVDNIIRNDSWCPKCNTNKGEEICRFIFEKFTNKKFPTKRPAWLKSESSSRALELDGYCDELRLAFEHQGKQHYQNESSHYESESVIERDRIKRSLCLKNNIKVLEIPQIGHYIKIEDAIRLIKKFLTENNILIKQDVSSDEIASHKFLIYDTPIKDLQKIAESRGGKCLSNSYLGHITPLHFECSNRHQWMARPNDVKRGSWCSICSKAGGKKKTINELKTMFLDIGIQCLSDIYINSKERYLWRCSKGHEFQSRYDGIKKSCPVCSKY
jgi:hypothetical protein